MKPPDLSELARLFQALSDANRLRILDMVRGDELCVCQIVSVLKLAPSTVSKHLAILEDAGLLESRKEGRWIHYRRRAAAQDVGDLLRWLDRRMSAAPGQAVERRAVRTVARLGAEKACAVYEKGKRRRA